MHAESSGTPLPRKTGRCRGRLRSLAPALTLVLVAGCAPVGPNQFGGSLLGAGTGALIGAQFGAGTGQLAAVGAGAFIGALIGGSIGTAADQAYYSRPVYYPYGYYYPYAYSYPTYYAYYPYYYAPWPVYAY